MILLKIILPREVLWVIGAREGNEEDFKDITKRTKSI